MIWIWQRKRQINKSFWRRESSYLLFLLPALLVYVVFSIYPMFSSFFYSLTNWDGFSANVRVIGFGNYIYMFKDPGFRKALSNTFLFVLMDVVLQNVLGLGTALLLETKLRGRNIMRGLFFVPVVLPSIVVSYIWTYIYGAGGLYRGFRHCHLFCDSDRDLAVDVLSHGHLCVRPSEHSLRHL